MYLSINKILLYKLFISNPNDSFYMQEIGRIIDKKPGVFQRTINTLEKDGFLISEFKANARFFRLNKEYIVLEEIKSILMKTSGDIEIFSDKINQVRKKTVAKPAQVSFQKTNPEPKQSKTKQKQKKQNTADQKPAPIIEKSSKPLKSQLELF